MSFETDCLAPFLKRLRQAQHCYVAYSGGLDSHVLLHATVKLLGKAQLSAIHVNHQLSENSVDWEQHCLHQCELLGVHLHTETVTVDSSGQGVEQAAREARYQVFESILKTNDLLLMAHHADDQVETVLYRLLRGSGVKGLAGIPQQRPLGGGELLRPLLNYRRIELESYARSERLTWIEDESNFVIDYDRNFLRHQVVSALAGRWPDYAERIVHSAALCSDADQLLEAVAAHDLEVLSERKERLGWSIALPELLDLSLSRRASLLRYWASVRGLALPGHKTLETIEHELLVAREDATPEVSWANAEMRRFGERVYLLPRNFSRASLNADMVVWDISCPIELEAGKLSVQNSDTGGLKLKNGSVVTIAYRHGGERCKPAGRCGSNTLKKLLQEARLEPWLRDYAPLVYVDGELAAVADLWVCEGFQAGPEEQGWQLFWQLD